MNDYLIACLWFFGLLFLTVFVPIWVGWALGRIRDRKPTVAPPEPERIDPRDLCSDLSCRERATTSIQGFGLCGQHAYERTGRGA